MNGEEEEEETRLLYVKINPDISMTIRVTKQELEEIAKVREEHPELTRSQAISLFLKEKKQETKK